MARGTTGLPDDSRKLLEFVEQGKLFAIQEWIAGGKPLQFDEVLESRRHLLEQAIQTGFHSIVEILLRAGGWSADDHTYALEFAREHCRYDI